MVVTQLRYLNNDVTAKITIAMTKTATTTTTAAAAATTSSSSTTLKY